jgi:hypothetical protein
MGSSLNGVIPRWTPERRPYDYRRSCVQGGRRERSAGVGKGDSDPSIRAANDPGEGGSFGEFDSLRSAKFLQSEQKLRAADPDRSGLIAPWHRTSSSFSPMELSARASPQRPSSITEVLNGRVQAADDAAAALPSDLRIVATDLAGRRQHRKRCEIACVDPRQAGRRYPSRERFGEQRDRTLVTRDRDVSHVRSLRIISGRLSALT